MGHESAAKSLVVVFLSSAEEMSLRFFGKPGTWRPCRAPRVSTMPDPPHAYCSPHSWNITHFPALGKVSSVFSQLMLLCSLSLHHFPYTCSCSSWGRDHCSLVEHGVELVSWACGCRSCTLLELTYRDRHI